MKETTPREYRHHPDLCVKKRLFKKVHVRGYYRCHADYCVTVLVNGVKGERSARIMSDF